MTETDGREVLIFRELCCCLYKACFSKFNWIAKSTHFCAQFLSLSQITMKRRRKKQVLDFEPWTLNLEMWTLLFAMCKLEYDNFWQSNKGFSGLGGNKYSGRMLELCCPLTTKCDEHLLSLF